jgi:hypothetical protein
MIKPAVQSQSYTSLSKVLKSQSAVECRFSQSSEISEIIAVYPQVSLISCEVSSGRVNYSGRLIASIVYTDEEGKLCRMQKGAEFSHFADDDSLAPAQTALCAFSCERTQIKREGSSFVVCVIVGADISVYARSQRQFILGCEGALLKTQERRLYSAITFSGESEVEDDFDADSLVDILIPSAQTLILSAECRSGEIAVDGEIYLSLFGMRGGLPVSLDRVIPFKAVIPCESSSVGFKPTISAEIRDLNVTASVSEEKGKCEVNFVCSLAFSGVFYDSQSQSVAVDAFSCDSALSLVGANESAAICKDIKVYSERISGGAACKSKLDYSCQFRAAALPNVEYDFAYESCQAEGSACATLVYEQNGEIKSAEINLPFALPLKGVCEEGDEVTLNIAVCGISVKQRAEGQLEAEAVLKISAYVLREERSEYIGEIEEGEGISKREAAISVIIPQKGDELWDIAKKLKTPPEKVKECNPQLKYPLEGSERIIVYRPKTI